MINIASVGGLGDEPLAWRTSSRSQNNAACVEVAFATDFVAVRDSKDRAGGILAFGPEQWEAFTSAVRAGNYNR